MENMKCAQNNAIEHCAHGLERLSKRLLMRPVLLAWINALIITSEPESHNPSHFDAMGEVIGSGCTDIS
jgi:hypothetical protein